MLLANKITGVNNLGFGVFAIAGLLLSSLLYRNFTHKYRRRQALGKLGFPVAWREILKDRIHYYNALSASEKIRFENEILIFLDEKRITGIKVELSESDLLMVASSAIIPIFGFPGWEYPGLSEILVYPGDFIIPGKTEKTVALKGMLGEIKDKDDHIMLLSLDALRQGYKNITDKRNVGIHEFIHMMDKTDGEMDGVPETHLDKEFEKPWLEMIERKIGEIQKGKSDIRPYGAINKAEFLAVVGEYFFEKPTELEKRHPELYSLLVKVFHQDPAMKFRDALLEMLFPYGHKYSPLQACPCGSGKKYGHCCMKEVELIAPKN